MDLPAISDGEDKSNLLANTLRNQYRHLRKWATRTNTNAFRLYDREVRSCPVAIDFYAGRFSVNYFAPSKESAEPPIELENQVKDALKIVFGASSESIFWRTRIRTKATRQYEKRGTSHDFFTVLEHGVKFWINLIDYLDTGLFLDHREARLYIAEQAKGKRLLNLFSYTGAFSVQAAAHGAAFTKSVDLSNTYTEWCRDNFTLNQLSLNTNEVIRADCLKFLPQEVQKYDIIVIDPPTISRSKKMQGLFDIQVDYIKLIQYALKLLLPGGFIFFSTNSKKFHFDETLFPSAIEISKKTRGIDFQHTSLHRAWKIRVLV